MVLNFGIITILILFKFIYLRGVLFMKYIVILGDGMADHPIPELNDRTPLQCAKKPYMDYLAQNGEVGMVNTIPEGCPPGSDVANLSVMGFDPRSCYTGRSPLEAVSMGINLEENDIAFRCNLVTLSDDEAYPEKKIIDHSSDEISTKEGRKLLSEINRLFKTEDISFYPGISYRHCMVWKNGPEKFIPSPLTPPHDIIERKIGEYLPSGDNGSILLSMMEKSYSFLCSHKINKDRASKGLRPANSIWFWGEGKRPSIPKFNEKYGIEGSVISAVDLIKGIGICAGLKVVDVEGATGNIHTNFTGKAEAALRELESGKDFVYVHIEAPDECGHRSELQNKIKSIELIDEKIVRPLLEGLKKYEDFKILVLPDHPTPLSIRTHSSDPVPFILYGNGISKSGIKCYDEYSAANTGLKITEGHKLMDRLIKG
jgi:2,3-bisphosphoglycerate-independent phosphoglycerate mutase